MDANESNVYNYVPDTYKEGVCSSGISIHKLPKQYYEQPIMDDAKCSPMEDDGTLKILPYINNRHLNKNTNLLGKYEDLGHAKTYYNPARDSLYARYSTDDWKLSILSNYNLSSGERSAADKVRKNASWVVKQTDTRTKNRQKHVTMKLGERADDIAFWGGELDNEIKSMKAELAALKNHKDLMEKALWESNRPLNIASECLRQRERRMGIELVKDIVEKGLNKEVSIIKACQDKFKKLIEKSHAQDKLNTAALHALEVDSQHKNHAYNIDTRMRELNNNSAGIGYHPGIEYYDNTITIPPSWLKYTQENIGRSQKERNNSEQLRNSMDECLRNSLNAMWNQFVAVNHALSTRIRETIDARNKLQAHLLRVMKAIEEMERNNEMIRQAIRDKEAPMKVAQTRLDERSRRINVELCNDPVMKELLKEVDEIRESVRILKARLKPSELSLARLIKTKTCLEHDIGVKENSLDLDSRVCLGMREKFSMDPSICALSSLPIPK